MNDTPTIDPAAFRDLQATAGADFVGELVQTFAEEAPQMLAALRAASAGGDAEGWRRGAHSLKSNALTFGAAALAAQARAAELGGFSGDAARDRATVDALQAALATAVARLQELARE